MKSARPSESTDTVSLIVALLVRFPELSSIRVHPADGTLTLSFAILTRLDAMQRRSAVEAIGEHVRAYLELSGESAARLAVTCEIDAAVSFLHVVRDVATFSREELALLGALLDERFGDALMKNPPPEDAADDDALARDEMADHAVEAMRDPARRKSLVGFREEKRVVVYFYTSRKNAKARGRS